MSKSMVEKYEQLLAQDPTSTVFVELARAYLERGDNDQAITVCQQGINHHPNSVTARVLWGKALINVGKAAEAMRQFDLATSIDKDNPHAYNLISEALLRKGLFRSALPILRKAAALQPNDGRISQWLEQTKAALTGGPAPILSDSSSVDQPESPAEGPPSPPSIEPVTSPAAPATPRASAPAAAPAARASAPVRQSAPAPAARPSAPAPAPASASGGGAMPYDPPSPEASNPPGAEPDVFAAFMAGKPAEPDAEATVLMNAYTGDAKVPPLEERPGPPVPTTELPAIAGAAARDTEERSTLEIPSQSGVSVSEIRTNSEHDLPVVMGSVSVSATDLPAAPDPFASVPSRADSTDTFRGLTSTFDALADGASAEVSIPRNEHLVPPPAVVSVRPSTESSSGSGLVDDVVSAATAVPTMVYQTLGAEAAAQPTPAKPAGSGGLLGDIPEELEAPSPIAARPEINLQATEAIAREYERELREKLEVTKQKKTFVQRHGLKLAIGAVLVVIAGALGGSFLVTRHRNQGETLDSAIAKGLTGITADTKEQYVAAIKALEQALTMDDSNSTALAYLGYAHAMLYAEHGKDPKNRDAAQAAMTGSVRSASPEYALVVDFLVADEATAPAARQQLLGSTLDKSLVHAHAGRLLLNDKKTDEALARLKKAVELDVRQTIALVALGDYYLSFQDWEGALLMMSKAQEFSKFHPDRVLGHAEARLELGRELPEALSDLEGLSANASIPDALQGRHALLLGRAQAANDKHDEAIKTLTDGLGTWGKTMAYPFDMALGQAYRSSGQMDKAQKAFEEALKLQPKNEDAKEGFGRVLLARSRERELLDRLKYEKDLRRVALLRGIAYSRLGDMKHAREELSKTQVNGKYPSEAVVYFSLADAAEEPQGDKAIEMLERLAALKTRQKATVQVALARVYMQKNRLDKAKAMLEEAAKDPQDYEGNALLGQLYLDAAVSPEVALEPLQRAVDRNGSHAPARHLLTRALLSLGRTADALKQVDAWTLDNPTLELAWKDAALVNLEAGHLKEAEAAAAKLPASSEDLEAWRIKARVLFARGGKDAMAALQKANKIDPKDAETFCEIGNAFVRQAGYDVAPAAYKAATDNDPKSPCGLAGPLHAHPVAKADKGKLLPRDQLAGLVTKSNNAWDKAFLQATLARVHLEEKDFKNALAMAKDATSTAPGHPVAWFALGEVLHRQKSDEAALEAYQKAAELDGSWSAAHLAVADLLLKQGGDALPRALAEYELIAQIDQNDVDLARAKKLATNLKKQLQK